MQEVQSVTENGVRRPSEGAPQRSVELSVIIPLDEYPQGLHELCRHYTHELGESGYSYEFIFVLDGPNPQTLQALEELKKQHPEIKVIALNRRFGEATALSAGFGKAEGQICLTLAPRLEVEPHEILRVLRSVAEQDADLVIAWRFPRRDSWSIRMQSRFFHWLVQRLTRTNYHDITCGLRAMRRQVAEEVPLYGDLHRFFPLLAYQRGFKVTEIPVQQNPQDAKQEFIYAPGLYLRRVLDLFALFFLFKFTKKPLRFFGLIGAGLAGVGALIVGYLGLYRFLGGSIAGRPLLILGVLLVTLGAQFFSLGLLGEIIIFTHARDMKDYQVRKILE